MGFPKTFVHYGDAERLQKEIEHLVSGMKRDGVELEVEMTKDGVHDLLMVKFWNEIVREGIYERVGGWLDGLGPRKSRLGSGRREEGLAQRVVLSGEEEEKE